MNGDANQSDCANNHNNIDDVDDGNEQIIINDHKPY